MPSQGAQLCRECNDGDLVCLYVSGSGAREGLFQKIANLFRKSMLTATTLDDVRQWIFNGLRHSSDGRLVIPVSQEK